MTKIDIAADEGTERVISKPSFHCIPPSTDSAFILSRLLSRYSSSYTILAAIAVARHYSAMIPTRDILFCIFFPSYLIFANDHIRRRRPQNASAVASGIFSGSDSAWFRRYMILALIVGLALPLATVLRAPDKVASLAAPHLFVLWCQIIGESMTKFNPNQRYIALMVIVGFSVYRMNLVVEWFLGSVSLYWDELGHRGAHSIVEDMLGLGYGWGLVLSSLNLLFWTYNLFVTILLGIVPEYLSDERIEASEYAKISRRT